ncbi:hypothetical protein [Faecalicatena contorta]|uniref:Uncharacterized protein n=1 Tax=Faecalicatena contorta TaxID=39482 RepID=A0A316AGP2_9FIRM|nr:hypothetical protein [Faecalicatena contorta]PWJ49007.1 hypothetical protein A8805_109150 [Faecalicatena contorta]SUQ15097.1 hypothetical protein SAMN05216529_109150 [Faecalicatena contorta]
METERYLISFVGLDPNYYTIDILADIWEVSAIRIYEETGIYVSGEIEEKHFVSRKMDDVPISNLLFVVESKRFPTEIEDRQEYWNAYKAVVEEVRYRLGNPRMDLTIEDIDMTHFEKI